MRTLKVSQHEYRVLTLVVNKIYELKNSFWHPLCSFISKSVNLNNKYGTKFLG